MTNATMPHPTGNDQPQATLEFLSGWREVLHGSITPSKKLIIMYDPARLPHCFWTWRDAKVGDIEAYIRFHPSGQLYVASTLEKIRYNNGPVVDLIPKPVEITVPPEATQVELWFRNFYQVSSRCEAWDSRFGQNYWYSVVRE